MAKPIPQPDYLILGEILRPHGIRGELRMKILTNYPERFITDDIETVFLGSSPEDNSPEPYIVKAARFHKQYLLLTLVDVTDRNIAETLRGQFVMIDMENAVPLEDDEFYLYQLIGMAVETEAGIQLGKVKDVIETGANDVYVVRGTTYGEVLVPSHEETLVDVDFEAQKITMRLPEGLLPDKS
ncbi:MAG: ribosome maturation factor RimM [Chloroflexota bacterium]